MWSRRRVFFVIVAVVLVVGTVVAVVLLTRGGESSTPSPTPTTAPSVVAPTAVPDEPIAVGEPADESRGISDARLLTSDTGRFTIEWESTNGDGATLRVRTANAGVLHEAPTSVGYHTFRPDVRTTLLQGDTVDFTVDDHLVARTPAITPADGDAMKHVLDTRVPSHAQNDVHVAANYSGNTVVASVANVVNGRGASVYKLVDGAWEREQFDSDPDTTVGVSGDGKSVSSMSNQTLMGQSPIVFDWDDETDTWSEASPVYTTPGGLYSSDMSWDGLALASVESYNATFENNNLEGAYANGLFVRRRTARGASWTMTKLQITGGNASRHHRTQISHDGRLVLVSDYVNNRLLCASDNAGTDVYRGTLSVTTSGCGVMGPATKCIMSAHIDGTKLVASRYTIDDPDTDGMPTWTLEKQANVEGIADYGYTGTPWHSERFNEDMTVMVLSDRVYDATGSGVNGAQDGASVSNSGHVWIFRRGADDAEWVLEANVNADSPAVNQYFGGLTGVALAASPACPLVAIPQSEADGANAAITLL